MGGGQLADPVATAHWGCEENGSFGLQAKELQSISYQYHTIIGVEIWQNETHR